jgi:hypothetical protein
VASRSGLVDEQLVAAQGALEHGAAADVHGGVPLGGSLCCVQFGGRGGGVAAGERVPFGGQRGQIPLHIPHRRRHPRTAPRHAQPGRVPLPHDLDPQDEPIIRVTQVAGPACGGDSSSPNVPPNRSITSALSANWSSIFSSSRMFGFHDNRAYESYTGTSGLVG